MRSFHFVSVADAVGMSDAAGGYGYTDTDLDMKTLPIKLTYSQPAVGAIPASTVTPIVINKPISTSTGANVTLHYRVIALYFDGAQSPLSSTVQVVIQ